MTTQSTSEHSPRALLLGRGRVLEYLTLGWDSIEAVVAITASVLAGSTALVGLPLNALFGWWWADPVAGLMMVPIIANEGITALRGETCDDCHIPLSE